jgi:uncharacterized protein
MISLLSIQTVVDRIAESFSPVKVILFGSYAYGEATENSDVDLLVVMPFTGSWVDVACAIRKAIRDIRQFPIDIVVKPPEEAAWRYEGYDPLIRSALDKGIVLYEQS